MKTKLIAFSGQKGGIGKSSFTALAASYYHYTKNLKVCVIDADFPQYSIVHMRGRDINLIHDDAYYRQLAKTQKDKSGNFYPIYKSLPEDILEQANKIKEGDTHYDIILMDMPGTLNSTGVIRTLSALDYIFAPIAANEIDMDSTLGFITFLQKKIVEDTQYNLKGIYAYWNKVKANESNPFYKVYDETISELGITILKTTIPNTVRFNKEATPGSRTHFISTYLPIHKKMVEGSRLPELFEETLTLIQ